MVCAAALRPHRLRGQLLVNSQAFFAELGKVDERGEVALGARRVGRREVAQTSVGNPHATQQLEAAPNVPININDTGFGTSCEPT